MPWRRNKPHSRHLDVVAPESARLHNRPVTPAGGLIEGITRDCTQQFADAAKAAGVPITFTPLSVPPWQRGNGQQDKAIGRRALFAANFNVRTRL